ncbi:hypothetical protein BIV25_04680 [Streptomyces sp. MUSC 14]|uniref:hypothetical protein n=1 Tax=Streptomyces sp. MUSC 14 TaxID=1354889 RepID=UPI0008F56D80|nr:hypothetical protein [Streptomyces sp. MUSC 14]OIK01686.1 hypothetical protein BIV25_04680 [Streptomyces sp. MUSC 14]
MAETWAFAGDDTAVTPLEAVAGLRRRSAAGCLEAWFTSSAGRPLSVLTDTERALVMLVDADGGPGGHAVTPGAGDVSGGFRLASGQCDTYRDEDTVPLDEALRIVRQVTGTGAPPADAGWRRDG